MTVSEPIRHVERMLCDPPKTQLTRGRPRKEARLDDQLMGMALLLGHANVIMQLARPGVGYGVLESRVESGRIDLHPIKRARTTFTYLAVAMAGNETQKAAFRRAVNGAHAQVYSTPDSPVEYNAFDPDLQLWVAACLYKGGVDFYRMFVGEIDEQDDDRHYREGMVLGTTLQVPPEMWPPDRAAFDRYWQDQLDKVHIDDSVRDYLYPIAVGRVRAVTQITPCAGSGRTGRRDGGDVPQAGRGARSVADGDPRLLARRSDAAAGLVGQVRLKQELPF